MAAMFVIEAYVVRKIIDHNTNNISDNFPEI